MQKTEHISLRWDEFGEHTASTFAQMKGDKDFVDVTFVSGDGASLYLIFVFFPVKDFFFNNGAFQVQLQTWSLCEIWDTMILSAIFHLDYTKAN